MSFQVKQVDGKPIVIETLGSDYSGAELAAMLAAGKEMIEQTPGPVFYIIDLLSISFTFNDVVEGANQAARGAQPPFHHPNVRESMLITRDKTIRMAAQGLNTPMFGNAHITVFDTLQEALAYCDTRMSA